MNQFKIEDSFALEPDKFVFAGTMVEGKVGRGMTFEVPEAGHKWKCTVRSVEFVRKGPKFLVWWLKRENRDIFPERAWDGLASFMNNRDRSPNQSRQPTPVVRLSAFSVSLVRSDWTHR